ncbi:hypothetical protein ACQQ9V_04700 [Hornefia butyriciproducens]|uniref:hypothetical protein n=1 Tax=Hornefia butyriciproducens TaxID=2652293 RepID=UPI003CFDFAC5
MNGLKSSDIIKCTVCARECRLQEGQTGACGARKAEPDRTDLGSSKGQGRPVPAGRGRLNRAA